MKLIIIIFFLVFSCNAINRLRRNDKLLKIINDYEQYLKEAAIKEGIKVWADDVLNLDTSLIDAGIGPKLAPNVPKEKLKDFSWVKIKKALLTDTNAKNIEIMKKFLRLRLQDTLNTIKTVTSKYKDFLSIPEVKEYEFKGTLKSFETPIVKVRLGETDYNLGKDIFQGKYILKNLGSGKLTSDIDFNVKFDCGSQCSFFWELAAVRIFIQAFNYKFAKEHQRRSSLEAYDINMYDSNFGSPKVFKAIQAIAYKQNDKKENEYSDWWLAFRAANRYSQLHIVYYDAYQRFKNHYNKNKDKDIERKINLLFGGVKQKLKNILKTSDQENLNCVSNLLEIRKGEFLGENTRGSLSNEERNMAAVWHLRMAANNKENQGLAMCHLLASNFFALEAFVSYGAVTIILSTQDKDWDHGNDEFLINTEHEWVDYALQNFGYAVEHYYEGLEHEDFDDARQKLAKYTVRLIQAVGKINTKKHKECWTDLLNKALKNWEKDEKNVNWTKETLEKHFKANQNAIFPYLEGGYKCISKHAFSFSESSAPKEESMPESPKEESKPESPSSDEDKDEEKINRMHRRNHKRHAK